MHKYTQKMIYISGHPRIEPRHFVEPDIIQAFNKQYMFLGCIEFISKVCIHIYAPTYIVTLAVFIYFKSKCYFR